MTVHYRDEVTERTSTLVEGFDDFVKIGSGASSTVYRARQVRMGRPVAVKVLHTDLSNERDRRVFERECRAMGVLSRHPHIVTVYSDATTLDGRACLVMELYHGNYRERLDSGGALALPELLEVGVKVGGALQAAHDMGVVHRDIKPHNIFLSDFGEPALGDFGISTIDDERSITAGTGLSVAYAAPEVVDDGSGDFLSDVYSLSASLFHLGAGHAPFAAGGVRSVMRRILEDDPPPIARPDAPASLDELLQRGMAKDPSDRPESAEELARTLRDVQHELGLEPTALPLRTADGRSGIRDATADRRAFGDGGHEGGTPTVAADREHDPEATLRRGRPVSSPSAAVPPSDAAGVGGEIDRRARPGLDRSWWIDGTIAVAVLALVVFALVRML